MSQIFTDSQMAEIYTMAGEIVNGTYSLDLFCRNTAQQESRLAAAIAAGDTRKIGALNRELLGRDMVMLLVARHNENEGA